MVMASAGAREFVFSNECNRPVRLAVNYLNVDGNWDTVGWWNVAADTKNTHLEHEGAPLASNSSTWYYYAETTDNLSAGIAWMGGADSAVKSFNGKSLDMRKIQKEESGNNIWSVADPKCMSKEAWDKKVDGMLDKIMNKNIAEINAKEAERAAAERNASSTPYVFAKDSLQSFVHNDSDYSVRCNYTLYSDGKLEVNMQLHNRATLSGFTGACKISVENYGIAFEKNKGLGATEGKHWSGDYVENIPVSALKNAKGIRLSVGDKSLNYHPCDHQDCNKLF